MSLVREGKLVKDGDDDDHKDGDKVNGVVDDGKQQQSGKAVDGKADEEELVRRVQLGGGRHADDADVVDYIVVEILVVVSLDSLKRIRRSRESLRCS